jgi:hypothetical protein
MFERMKEMGTDIFLFEAHANHYLPEPPDGFFAVRSNKRRLFLRLNNGAVPAPEEINELIHRKEFIEIPL